MCFHWCSACEMLRTEVGRQRRSNKMLFFYSILPLCCCFFISVYSLISSLPPCVCVPSAGDARAAAAAALWQDWMKMSHTYTHSLSLSLTPPSPTHSSLSRSVLPSLSVFLSLTQTHTHTHFCVYFVGNERISCLHTLSLTLLLSHDVSLILFSPSFVPRFLFLSGSPPVFFP